jgi:GNAT superfamily N-acetyltransferase
MPSQFASETLESHSQLTAFWSYLAQAMEHGEIDRAPGVEFLWGNVVIPFFNVAFVHEPVADAADWARRLEASAAFAEPRKNAWLLIAADDALEPLSPEERDAAVAGIGLAPFMRLTGMIADQWTGRDSHPSLALSVASDTDGYIAMNAINIAAYELPAGMGDGSMDRKEIFAPGFPVVGSVNGDPASCTLTVPVDGRLYVAFVATKPNHRRQGFAEICMKRSLDLASAASGLKRTVLHASDAGRPVYERMGYRAVAGYTAYMPQMPGH